MRNFTLKKTVALLLIGISALDLYAQDTMVTQDGDVKTVYVVDIGGSAVFYKTENTDNAAIQSISKDQIFVLKHPDGTKYDLGNAPTPATQPSVSPQTPTPQLGDEVSEEARQRNKELIESINNYVPEYARKVGGECKRVFCVMGVTEGSCMVNDDVELSIDIEGNEGVYYGDDLFILTVKNKTTNTIYVDLGNTFFISGENSQAYYVPSSTSTSSTTGSGVSVNAGAVAGALGVGGTIGKLAGGVNVGGGSSSSTVSVTYSQRVVAIPPMSSKKLDEQLLFSEIGIFCNGLAIQKWSKNSPRLPNFHFKSKKKDPDFENGHIHSYSESESPVRFSVLMTYSNTEDCSVTKKVTTTLYLRNIIGIHNGGSTQRNMQCCTEDDIPRYKDCLHFIGLNADAVSSSYGDGTTFPRP